MFNLIDLTGKNIIITGASSGIGRETASLLARLGAKVILIARREDKLKEAVREIGSSAVYYSHDLSDLDSISGLVKRIVNENGAVDGFVHSAGIGPTRPIRMLKPSTLNEVMTINFYSFIELIRCITGKKNFNPGLSIVGISSVSSKMGNQAKVAYCASKAAMDASVRCIAKELADKKIRINTINPGFISTDIYQQFRDVGTGSDDVEMIMKRQYMGLGEPADVANMAAYLLSDAAKFITGSSVDLDGGRLTW